MIEPGARIADRYEVREIEAERPAFRAIRAIDREVEVEVALWLVRPELLHGEGARAALLADALRARAVSHASLRRIFDAGDGPDGCYVTLQALSGSSLAERIVERRALADDELARLARALGDALAVAQVAGLAHGFLHPADVVIAGDLPKLAGAGLWRALDARAVAAAFGAAARYLAPEVREGRPPSARADVYSLAVILGELALGGPSDAKGPDGDLRGRLRAERPAIAHALEDALDSEPAERPASASVLAVLLENKAPLPRSGRARGAAGGAGPSPAGPSPAAPSLAAPSPAAPSLAAPSPAAPSPAAPSPAAPSPAGPLTPPGEAVDGDDTAQTASRLRVAPAMIEATTGETKVEIHSARGERARLDEEPGEDAPTRHYLALDERPLDDFPEEELAAPPAPRRAPTPVSPDGTTLERPLGARLAHAVGADLGPARAAERDLAAAPGPDPDPDPGRAPGPHRPPASASPPATAHASRPATAPDDEARPGPGDEPAAPGPGWPVAGPPALDPRGYPAGPAPRPAALYAGLALAGIVAVVGAVWLAATLLGGRAGDARVPAPAHVVPGERRAAPAGGGPIVTGIDRPSPCPVGMRHVAEPPAFCVDEHEAPGEAFTPATSVTLEDARRACEARNKRLCTSAEWERACRGPGGSSYPYGETYVPGRCNVRGPQPRLAPAGSFAGCVSAAGARDMSGNAAEWVAEGVARGGSVGDGGDGRCSRERRLGAQGRFGDVGYRCCRAAQ